MPKTPPMAAEEKKGKAKAIPKTPPMPAQEISKGKAKGMPCIKLSKPKNKANKRAQKDSDDDDDFQTKQFSECTDQKLRAK